MKNEKIPINEDIEQSCCEIVYFINKTKDEKHKDERTLLYQDLVTKLKGLRPSLQHYYLSQILISSLPDDMRENLMNVISEKPNKKPQFDIVIVTVIPPELTAVKIAFGIPLDRDEDHESYGYRFWEFGFRNKDGNNFKAVVTMVGEQGTKACINACNKLFSLYSVDLCILIGIAAGIKEEFTLGDVISPINVIDYENQRLEPTGSKKQPESFKIDTQLKRDLSYFISTNTDWQSRLNNLVQSNQLFKKATEKYDTFKPNFSTGVLFTGAKLIADGKTLYNLRENYHEKGKSADKEGSGFASACEEASIKWLIFKGISDYGDENKSESDNFQIPYSLSAAVAAQSFLENGYKKTPKEKS